MQRRRMVVLAALAATLLASLGCNRVRPPPSAGQPASSVPPTVGDPVAAEPRPVAGGGSPSAAPAATAPTATDAASVIAPGRNFVFSIADSPQALAHLTRRCANDAKGDAVRQHGCIEEARKVVEGLRFEREGDQWFFVLWGREAGREILQPRAPIARLDAPADQLRFRPSGAATGTLAAARGLDTFDAVKADGMVMAALVVDADTVAMVDPHKGRLVFKRD